MTEVAGVNTIVKAMKNEENQKYEGIMWDYSSEKKFKYFSTNKLQR